MTTETLGAPLALEFETIDAACAYRAGRGGWTFQADNGRAFAFAPHLTRGDIMRAPYLVGLSGRFN